MNILIADDEQTAIKNLTRVLRKIVPDASVDEADEAGLALCLCEEKNMDVAFLDINMPDMDGLTLAKKIKQIQPLTNIIIVTAYPEFALDAFKLYASDYILKPALTGDVRRALMNLRNPVREYRKGLYVQCFGFFAVFYDGRAIRFGRAKAKELFAYLIDRKGAECSNAQLRAVLWADEVKDDEKQRRYFAQVVYALRTTLKELDCEEIFIQRRDSYAIVPDKIECDYYQALNKEPEALARYEGEYMSQYEWAEMRIGSIKL